MMTTLPTSTSTATTTALMELTICVEKTFAMSRSKFQPGFIWHIRALTCREEIYFGELDLQKMSRGHFD